MFNNIINKILLFLKNPNETNKDYSVNYKKIIIEFLVFDLCLCFLYGLLNSILFLIFDDYKEVFNNKNISQNPNLNRWVIVIIIAPLIEELAFRIGLKINRKYLATSLGIQFVIFLTVIDIIILPFTFRIILMLVTSLFFYILLTRRFLSVFRKNQNLFIYYNILAFGFLHSLNFNYTEFSHYIFIPFLISIQLFLGLYLSYSRFKYGFYSSLIFHITHNLFFFLLGALYKMFQT